MYDRFINVLNTFSWRFCCYSINKIDKLQIYEDLKALGRQIYKTNNKQQQIIIFKNNNIRTLFAANESNVTFKMLVKLNDFNFITKCLEINQEHQLESGYMHFNLLSSEMQ